jgi:hypothetical protein
MRWMITVGLLIASGAMAQVDPDPDGIGIYFDAAATQNATAAAYGDVVTAYLVATHPSLAGNLFAWQAFVISSPGDACITGEPIQGGNIYMNMPPCGPNFGFIVQNFDPRPPVQDATVLATLTITMTDENQVVTLFVGGATQALPSYNVGGIGTPWQDLHPASGSADLPVARINGEAPVPVLGETWGALKSLFR